MFTPHRLGAAPKLAQTFDSRAGQEKVHGRHSERSEESLLRARVKARCYPLSVFTSALTPFHKICTPIHTSKNEDNRKITFIPFGPIAAANRPEYP